MSYFYQRRKDLGLSQPLLATDTGLSERRISDFECGRALPTLDQARALEKALRTAGLPHQGEILSAAAIRRLVRGKPFELPPVNAESWQRMDRFYREQVESLNLSDADRLWISTNFSADSGVDGVGVCSLVASGAKKIWSSPTECCYRGHGVVDRNGMALGERLLPALHWITKEFEAVLWPQVGLQNARSSYRVDYLVLIRIGKRLFWRIVEVDGPHHNQERDDYRSRLLQASPIRIPDRVVKDLQLPAALAKAFRELR